MASPRFTIILVNLAGAVAAQNSTSEALLPWQSSPNQRGTLDIIYSCLFTIFICVWTAVHLNVPAPEELHKTAHIWLRRIKWVLITVMIPEVVMLFAFGQFSNARHATREMSRILQKRQQVDVELAKVSTLPLPPAAPFKTSTSQTVMVGSDSTQANGPNISVPDIGKNPIDPSIQQSTIQKWGLKQRTDEVWSLRHAFFANMGGFRLKDKSGRIYRINAEHINFLVEHEYIPLPDITSHQINDRSKSDSLAKFLAAGQIGWLGIQVAARAVQNLETTYLEMTTLSFIVCTFGSFIAWYRKPYDVQTSVVLHMGKCDVNDIAEIGQHEVQAYADQHKNSRVVKDGKLLNPYTKLDMIDDGGATYTNQATDGIRFWRRGIGRKTAYQPDRIRNDRLPLLHPWVTVVNATITIAYAGLHVAAWNIPLPTWTEQVLWRVSSLVLVGSVVAWLAMDHAQGVQDLVKKWIKLRRAAKAAKQSPSSRPAVGVNQQSAVLAVPPWRVPLSTVVTIVYMASRAYVVVESFVALRSMPASSYVQVDWGKVFPHV